MDPKDAEIAKLKLQVSYLKARLQVFSRYLPTYTEWTPEFHKAILEINQQEQQDMAWVDADRVRLRGLFNKVAEIVGLTDPYDEVKVVELVRANAVELAGLRMEAEERYNAAQQQIAHELSEGDEEER